MLGHKFVHVTLTCFHKVNLTYVIVLQGFLIVDYYFKLDKIKVN